MPKLILNSFDRPDASDILSRISVAPNGAEGTGTSVRAKISADGRYVVFSSSAGNLVPGAGADHYDVFRKDLRTGEILRVNTAIDGGLTNWFGDHVPSISADGRYVVFESAADNIVVGAGGLAMDIFRKDMLTGAVIHVTINANNQGANANSANSHFSADGRYVVFQSDATNWLSAKVTGMAPRIFSSRIFRPAR